MKRTAIILALLLACYAQLVFAQGSESHSSAQEVTICEVTANAAKYDGKEITVRGLYRMVIHGTILIGSACPKVDVNLREAPGYKASKKASTLLRALTKKNQFTPVEVVLRGTFRVAHQGQCFGQICAAYEIETTELVSAQAASALTSTLSDTHSRQSGAR
jgi:hypothetical protein